MFALIRLNDKSVILQDGVYAIGTHAEALVYMMRNLGIRAAEVRFAIDEMNARGTNYAHFGLGGTFIYSERKDVTLPTAKAA